MVTGRNDAFLSEAADCIDERLFTRAHGRGGTLQRGRQIGGPFHALAVAAVRGGHLLERGTVAEFREPPPVLAGGDVAPDTYPALRDAPHRRARCYR